MAQADRGLKILVAVTFRDFNGSENEKIQRLFIESLRNQTYKNWRMVVTVFNEKFVEREVSAYPIDASFYSSGPVSGYRFSLTDVLLNAVSEASKCDERTIVVWTTCDILLEPNFFEELVRNRTDNFFAISHPHLTYRDVEDWGAARAVPASLRSGIDLVVMDGQIFQSGRNVDAIKKYRFTDWGIFEHFLVGLAILNKGPRINLFGTANISKIENDRVVGEETNRWLAECWRRNKVPLTQFIADHDLSHELLDLTYCDLQFSVLKNKRAFYLMFARDLMRYVKDAGLRKLSRRLPGALKGLIKKVAE
ncbi:hypothetical protein [Thiobacillus sedimenti]|uniref:Uncharacterized protein n=1 Tax=Thiobacillus sedimenti TaxID=3110231 RepID=A0ABZ1CHE1_9PROT|nr:hypothetical protein [Thiobacillus sp. SCUT-2]WRS38410.1 hypothetical protein VA613_10380 [Thiobacillus sp. SCUT-2]